MVGRHGSCLVAFLLLSCTQALPLLASDLAARSAPQLGGDTYTIHADGKLSQVLGVLGRVATGWDIFEPRVEGGGQYVPSPILDMPVSLDFDKADLRTILLSLCSQTGLVYSVNWGGRWDIFGDTAEYHLGTIELRPGNVRLDARPTTDLGDCIVRVERIQARSYSGLGPRWGLPLPKPGRYDTLEIGLRVIPKTAEAAGAFVYVGRKVTATADTGETLAVPGPERQWDSADGPALEPRIEWPLPPPGAKCLRRVEGVVYRHRQAKINTLLLPAGVGQVVKDGDVSAKVESWQVSDGRLEVFLGGSAPPWPSGSGQSRQAVGRLNVDLIAADGSHHPMRAHRDSPWIERDFWCRYDHEMPLWPGVHEGRRPEKPVAIKALQLTFIRYGTELESVPFVLKDVPLPQPPVTKVWDSSVALVATKTMVPPTIAGLGPVSLGNDRFVFHNEGTASEVCQRLENLTGWHIELPPRGMPGATLADMPVTLRLDNANMDEILTQIGRQAGMVYEIRRDGFGEGSFPEVPRPAVITFRAGQVDVDPRPTGVTDRYVVRADDTVLFSNRKLTPEWGSLAPKSTVADNLIIRASVIPRIEPAAQAYMGVARYRAVTEDGTVLHGIVSQDGQGWGASGPTGFEMRFPLPPAGARKLARIEGMLRERSSMKTTSVTIPANSAGRAFWGEDVCVRVMRWELRDSTLTVHLHARVPPLSSYRNP
jgi:hypothetical protein